MTQQDAPKDAKGTQSGTHGTQPRTRSLAAALTEEALRLRAEVATLTQQRNTALERWADAVDRNQRGHAKASRLLSRAKVLLIGAEYALARHGQTLEGWRELERDMVDFL